MKPPALKTVAAATVSKHAARSVLVPHSGDVMRTFVLGLCASFLLFGCADDGSEPGGDSDASSADVTDGSGGDSTDAGAEEDTAPEEDVTPEEDGS